MANEITYSMALAAFKPAVMSSALGRSVSGLTSTMTGNVGAEGVLLVGTSATAIPVGQVTQPHWAFFKNMDASNYLTIRNGASGADVLQLYPGDAALLPLLTTGTFYAVANTAACYLEYLILSL